MVIGQQPIRPRSLQVVILDVNLALLTHPAPQHRHVDCNLRSPAADGRGQTETLDPSAPMLRHDSGDLRQNVGGGTAEFGIGPTLDDADADQQCLELVLGEHQGRQIVAVAQQVADAGGTFDRHPLPDQFGNIPVDRAHRDLELGREGVGGDGAAGAAQDLDDLEQSVGAPHGYGLPHAPDRILSGVVA